MVTYGVTLGDVEKFILILVRIASFLVVAPLIGGRDVPNKVKIGFTVALTIFLTPIVDAGKYTSSGVISYSTCIVLETLTGLLMGFAAYICTFIVVFAGNIIDMDIGLSMATEFNPITNTEVTISGNLYLYFITLIMIASNMHLYIVGAIIDSFKLIPSKFPDDIRRSTLWCQSIDNSLSLSILESLYICKSSRLKALKIMSGLMGGSFLCCTAAGE